jgi:hypothetical protein
MKDDDNVSNGLCSDINKLKDFMGLTEYLGLYRIVEFDDEYSAAKISINYDYVWFRIFLSKSWLEDVIKENNFDELTEMLIHEFIHVYIDRMFFIADDESTKSQRIFLNNIRETTVERLSRLVFKTLPKDLFIKIKDMDYCYKEGCK